LGQYRAWGYQIWASKRTLSIQGGIKNGKDVFEYILAGAEAVQVGTQFEIEGVKCFKRINNELKVIMKKKGYASLNKYRGKLKN